MCMGHVAQSLKQVDTLKIWKIVAYRGIWELTGPNGCMRVITCTGVNRMAQYVPLDPYGLCTPIFDGL